VFDISPLIVTVPPAEFPATAVPAAPPVQVMPVVEFKKEDVAPAPPLLP
jgi:hypothetical protein